ncbi:MAG: hypothetical protein OXI41_04295 [Chloroflexota bacterium]|nr:hypothetical protein [Chloroflexota bacterium]MDE2895473.1 hypothetical protein [Chloroflexota bacterium]
MASSQAAEFWLCFRPFGDDSDAVRMVDAARLAVVRDTAARAREAGFSQIRLFATVDVDGLPVEWTSPSEVVGNVVAEAALGLDTPVCYAGSGMPAMTSQDWSQVLATMQSGRAVANRVFSCDWVGVPSARALSVAVGEEVDNRFARRLRDDRTVDVVQFERSARSLLDLDTPADLAVLAACAEVESLQIGTELGTVIAQWRDALAPAIDRVAEAFETVTRHEDELMISGRVSGSDWSVVDRDTSCRVRVLAEERGLRTRGAPARSLMASLYEFGGLDQFVLRLSSLCDAMLWDTRPFFSHLGWNPTRSDRFWSDLSRWDEIADSALRDLVHDLAPHRVLMGGHSLVAGGMLAGIDQAWTRRELSG